MGSALFMPGEAAHRNLSSLMEILKYQDQQAMMKPYRAAQIENLKAASQERMEKVAKQRRQTAIDNEIAVELSKLQSQTGSGEMTNQGSGEAPVAKQPLDPQTVIDLFERVHLKYGDYATAREIKKEGIQSLNDAAKRELEKSQASHTQAQADVLRNPPNKFIPVAAGGAMGNQVTGELGSQVPEKTPTKTGEDKYVEHMTEAHKLKTGKDPDPGAIAKWQLDYKNSTTQLKIDNPSPSSEFGRLDKSYQYNSSQLVNLAKPIRERAERLDRLRISLDANSPQADALIAPELLTAMAGGQGSGLRMNEAEISRIVHGRSNWEDLKAKLQKWNLDPSKALSITTAQRAQVRDLVRAMSDKVGKKLSVLDEAQQSLISSQDVVSHRNALAKATKELGTIDEGSIQKVGESTSGVSESDKDRIRRKYVNPLSQ